MSVAGVAHPVERHLAKVEVASSSLVTRSMKTVSERKRSSFLRRENGRLERSNVTPRWGVAGEGLTEPNQYFSKKNVDEPRHPVPVY